MFLDALAVVFGRKIGEKIANNLVKMTAQRMVEWLTIALTVVLLVVLKWSHIGVTHYNWFLSILLAWCLGLVVFFRLWGREPGEREMNED